MEKQAINPEYMYSSEEVTEYLNVSLRTTQRLLKNGLLPSFRIHGQYRIKGLDIMNYLDSVKVNMGTASLEKNKPAKFIDLLDVKPLKIEFSPELIETLLEQNDLMEEVNKLREELVLELGFILPGVEFRDNTKLSKDQYQIMVNGVLAEKGNLSTNNSLEALLKHIGNVSRNYAHEIISREDVFAIIERIRKNHYIVVEDVIAEYPEEKYKLSIGKLTKIFRELLRERVSIQNMPIILEIIADNIHSNNNIEYLVEKVREGLSLQICAKLMSEQGIIEVITISPDLELELKNLLNKLPSEMSQDDLAKIRKFQSDLKDNIFQTNISTIICAPELRKALHNLLERNFPNLNILSYTGISRHSKISQITQIAL